MKHAYFLATIALLLAVALSGCGGGGGGGAASGLEPAIRTVAEASQRGTWTVLVYLDADNDLESAGIRNFNQMEVVGSTRDVRVIVQMDRTPGYDSSNGDWTDTRRFLVIRDPDTNTMNSIRLDDPSQGSSNLGELDMGDYHTLKDFVEWGVQRFPADHYCLVIWDHGTGWNFRSLLMASPIAAYKYIAVDDTSGGHALNVPDIPLALAGVNMDVVAFDACYMQQLETAYQLRNSARYLVGSTTTEPSPGYNYARWLARMNGSTTPEQLCHILVEEYMREYGAPQTAITQSAVDLSKIGEVASAAGTLSQVLISDGGAHSPGLASARNAALNYTGSGSTTRHDVDLLDYANRCNQQLGAGADAVYAALRDAVGSAVIAEGHNPDMPSAHGLSIYLPPPGSYEVRYGGLALAQDTVWDEWIRAQRQ